jgi:two-component system CheB/CheR fusion protein
MTVEVADSAELRRRIRRLLAVLRSIAVDMQVRGRDSHESARHFAGRVDAVGRAALAPIAAGMDLESLVLDELLAHRVRAGMLIGGPSVRLNAKSAELMSLAIHELATNSVKFGALSQLRTTLRVVWWFTGLSGSRLHFEWAEGGVRMAPPSRRKKSGFGSQVVTRLIAGELRGQGNMVFSSKGLLCTIEFPAREALLQNE